jgi:hypothetical protein
VNAWRRLDNVPLAAEVRRLNGEPAVIVRVADEPPPSPPSADADQKSTCTPAPPPKRPAPSREP